MSCKVTNFTGRVSANNRLTWIKDTCTDLCVALFPGSSPAVRFQKAREEPGNEANPCPTPCTIYAMCATVGGQECVCLVAEQIDYKILLCNTYGSCRLEMGSST